MAKLEIVVAVLLVFTGSLVECQTTACDDIDTQACQLMIQTKPNLCTDETLSKTACPKFCKLCPLECYHCDDAVADYHNCNTTKLCAQGQVCMRKELKSWVDGHHEYQLSCEDSTHCDGSALSFAFGKRNIDSRDLTVSCCDTDRCNYPQDPLNISPSTPAMTTTAKPACRKDVFVVVDDSERLEHADPSHIKQFLQSLVGTSTVGPNGLLMSLATFAERVVPQWGLTSFSNNISLNQALAGFKFSFENDDNEVINKILKHLLKNNTHVPNRPDADDVIVVLTSQRFHEKPRDLQLENALKQRYPNIITIGISDDVSAVDLQTLATDNNHEFNVFNSADLGFVVPSVQKLICKE